MNAESHISSVNVRVCLRTALAQKTLHPAQSILHVLKTSAANCYTYPTLINLILIFFHSFLSSLCPSLPWCLWVCVCVRPVLYSYVPMVDDLTGIPDAHRSPSLSACIFGRKGVRNRKVRQRRNENIKKKIIHTIKYCTKCIIICLSLKWTTFFSINHAPLHCYGKMVAVKICYRYFQRHTRCCFSSAIRLYCIWSFSLRCISPSRWFFRTRLFFLLLAAETDRFITHNLRNASEMPKG